MLWGCALSLCLALYCAVDVACTPRSAVRGLPKPLWLGLIAIFPLFGSLGWLVRGRPWGLQPSPAGPAPAADAGASAVAGRGDAVAADDEAAFLRELRARAEEQRAVGAAQRRAALAAEGDDGSSTAS